MLVNVVVVNIIRRRVGFRQWAVISRFDEDDDDNDDFFLMEALVLLLLLQILARIEDVRLMKHSIMR